MTIVTKPLSDKKDEKNEEPLVNDVKVVVPDNASGSRKVDGRDVEHLNRVYVVRKRRLSTYVAFAFLATILLCFIPIFANLLRTALRAEMYHGWCNVLYDEQQASPFLMHDDPAFRIDLDKNIFDLKSSSMLRDEGKSFREEFTIEEGVEKINVPDFSGGRHSRFIHDFKTNKTGIVDFEAKRCFVMPLNKTSVLPPENLIDLLTKMNDGYYDVDTSILKETMRVVLPALEDRSSLGTYIQLDCARYPIYRLERYTASVYKRSVEGMARFTVFSGKKTHQVNIINYNEVLDEGPVAMA